MRITLGLTTFSSHLTSDGVVLVYMCTLRHFTLNITLRYTIGMERLLSQSCFYIKYRPIRYKQFLVRVGLGTAGRWLNGVGLWAHM